MGYRKSFKSVADLRLRVTLAVFAPNGTLESGRASHQTFSPNTCSSTSAVSARDTVTARSPDPRSESVERAMCGPPNEERDLLQTSFRRGIGAPQNRGMPSSWKMENVLVLDGYGCVP